MSLSYSVIQYKSIILYVIILLCCNTPSIEAFQISKSYVLNPNAPITKRRCSNGDLKSASFSKDIPTRLEAAILDKDLDIQDSSSPDVQAQPVENYPFQAEVKRVLDIIVNSLYTDKDVFLRELVSNAADACDKRRILKESPYKGSIRIYTDKNKRTLTIEDDGIGMSKADLIQHLGTIAESGTFKFKKENFEEIQKQLQQNEGTLANDLIGQFGVGFYSAFLVADKVDVYSVPFNQVDDPSKLWVWSSTSGQNFTIAPGDINAENERYSKQYKELEKDIFSKQSAETLQPDDSWRGTRIVLHLKEECDDYLEDYRLKELLKKYSEFLSIPIYLLSERVEYERVPDEGQDASGATKYKTITQQFKEWLHINTQPPIWRRDERILKEKDYVDFYKSTFKSYDDPLSFLHMSVEGQVSFRALLFVPGTLPWELSRNMFDEESRGIRLYVKRVFINDKFQEAVPRWLTFIRGVIDSDDLPLNVGREILQKSKMLKVIHKRIAAKAIDMISALKKQGGDKWNRFWENYGKYIKVGAVEDRENQEALASFVQFCSTHTSHGLTTIDEYISRMEARNRSIEDGTYKSAIENNANSENMEIQPKEPLRQHAIYYITADNKKAAEDSPALELLKAYGFEVLFGVEPLDEFFLASLSVNQYKGYQILDANKADLKLKPTEVNVEGASEKEKVSQSNAASMLQPSALESRKIELGGLIEWMQQVMGPRVHNVTLSDRLISNPAVLVQGDFGLSPTMQRYMKQQAAAQGISEQELFGTSLSQPILEINPFHPIIKQLDMMHKSDPSNPSAKELAQQLYDVAALQGGYTLGDPGYFARNVIKMMKREADAYISHP